MRISTKNLDPNVQSAFWSAFYSSQTMKSRADASAMGKHFGVWWKGYGGEIKRGLGIMALACGGLFGLAAATGSPAADTAFGVAVAGSGLTSAWWFARNYHSLDPDELRVFLPTMELSRVERIYCECVLMLMESESSYGERAARDMIRQLNGLLSTDKLLAEQRESLLAALGKSSVDEAESERAELARRLDVARDSIEREALKQSLALCESRLENGRAMLPGVRRIEAQQEVILQTLLSVQSSLARLQVAPKAVSRPELEEVTRTVAGINAQTIAVEQAVEEVLTVRSV
jgi:hypothetical protein